MKFLMAFHERHSTWCLVAVAILMVQAICLITGLCFTIAGNMTVGWVLDDIALYGFIVSLPLSALCIYTSKRFDT